MQLLKEKKRIGCSGGFHRCGQCPMDLLRLPLLDCSDAEDHAEQVISQFESFSGVR